MIMLLHVHHYHVTAIEQHFLPLLFDLTIISKIMELSSNSEREMNKMLLNFERDATFSLKNIRQSGYSLDYDFRQIFIRISKERYSINESNRFKCV